MVFEIVCPHCGANVTVSPDHGEGLAGDNPPPPELSGTSPLSSGTEAVPDSPTRPILEEVPSGVSALVGGEAVTLGTGIGEGLFEGPSVAQFLTTRSDAIEESPEDQDRPPELPPEVIQGLHVDSTVDPMHVHDADASRHPHGDEYPSEGFLSNSDELNQFLRTTGVPEPLGTTGLKVDATDSRTEKGREFSGGMGDQQEEAGISAWPVALLASYASVLTLICAWLWWQGRGQIRTDREYVSGTPAEASAEADPGVRSGQSVRVERAEPIPPERVANLGETLRVGALEVTPLVVSKEPVELERMRPDGQAERKHGGSDALTLLLKLRNVSEDAIFAPLDEGYLREPERRLPDSYIETKTGERVYGYRLPAQSEWGIVGQTFPALRPGESHTGLVISDINALERLNGPVLWRIRVRTGVEKDTVIGVRFNASELDFRKSGN